MLEELKNVIEYKEFLWQFTAQQLKTRYSGSILGFLWTLLNPVLSCLAFAVVFALINRWNLRTTGLYFFAGYIPWFFFVNATTSATFSIIGNAQYVTRIYVPRIIFPLASLLVNLADLLAGMLVVFAYMIIFGTGFSPALAIIPLGIVLFWVFALGIGFMFATVNVFLRDFQFLWTSVSFLWFFFTPILYPMSALPETVRPYFEANPVLPFIRMFQQPICDGVMPSIETLGLALLYSVTVLIVGVTAFTRSERSFYLYI